VVKHDNSGAGDGNLVVPMRDGAGRQLPEAELVAGLAGTVPQWYVDDLAAGGVVEELVAGRHFSSPSAQLEVVPQGGTRLLSTHEQILGGENGQVYSGCRFPADPAYAAQLAEYGTRVADRLGELGARGRLGVDFVSVRRQDGWEVLALEVNLRKGGTTHPFTALRHLVPGRYDGASGQYLSEDGTPRCYRSSDGILDQRWRSLKPAQVIEAVANAGLEFDARTRTGVVLHMLSCLKVDGRLGATAIAGSPAEADELYAATRETVASLA
jgi:predicted ATP-grasp superfamily ATP-dependent carboligase